MSRLLRSLLVVVLATAALVPAAGPASAVTIPTTLTSARAAQVGPVTPGFPIDAVGVSWDVRPGAGQAEPAGAVRFRHGGAWGRWIAFEEDGAQAVGSFSTALVAGGDAEAYQVRGVPAGAEVVALNTTDGPAREVRSRPAGAADALANCWSRYDWGADEAALRTRTRAFAPAQVLTVHHTGAASHASGDPAAWVRSIYAYHLSQGWDDIGYQYLVGPGGQLFEGRRSDVDSEACQSDPDRDGVLGDGSDFAHDAGGRLVTASHTGGYNTGNAGVSVLGDMSSTLPSAAARAATVEVLAHLAGRHGLTVSNTSTGTVVYDNGVNPKRTVQSVAAHRDFVATDCPGGAFYADLPRLRDEVAAAMTPASPAPAPAPAPEPTRDVRATLALSTTGGKRNDQHLVAQVTVLDVGPDPDTAVAGVAVTVRAVDSTGRFSQSRSGTTTSAGTVVLSWNSVKAGTYTVTVTDVADPDWDGTRTSATLTKR